MSGSSKAYHQAIDKKRIRQFDPVFVYVHAMLGPVGGANGNRR
jgi:hypothetical protein